MAIKKEGTQETSQFVVPRFSDQVGQSHPTIFPSQSLINSVKKIQMYNMHTMNSPVLIPTVDNQLTKNPDC
jgi:hypothetical protein